MDLQCCNYHYLPSGFSSKFQSSIVTIFHHNFADKRRSGFGQWMNSSIIHDNIRSHVHKKYHPKSCHADIEYHMTLSIIFSVVNPKPTMFTAFQHYSWSSYPTPKDTMEYFKTRLITLLRRYIQAVCIFDKVFASF